MGNLSGGAAWIFAVMACGLLALARSNITLGISSDHANWELQRRIVRLQRERDSALSSLTSLRGKLERCRRYIYACESRAHTGGRSVQKQRREPGRHIGFTERGLNRKRGACMHIAKCQQIGATHLASFI